VGMRSVLPEWYGHDDAAIEKVVTTGTVAVDTNVLLDLYRVGREQREQIPSALEAVRNRLFIPYQVAVEYQRNRLNVAGENESHYNKLIDSVQVVLQESDINRLRDPQHQTAVREILDRASKDVRRKLRKMIDDHVIHFEDVHKYDPIRKALDELIGPQKAFAPPQRSAHAACSACVALSRCRHRCAGRRPPQRRWARCSCR
jgi:PIN like domain